MNLRWSIMQANKDELSWGMLEMGVSTDLHAADLIFIYTYCWKWMDVQCMLFTGYIDYICVTIIYVSNTLVMRIMG